MLNIVIIGVGQIGSRHLQSLSNLKEPTCIWAIDISDESLETANSRFYEMEGSNTFKGQLYFEKNLSNVPSQIDVAIITSTAAVRYQLFSSLLNVSIPNYIIFEKVLFQDPVEYEKVEQKLSSKGIAAFVNFPRRLFPVYKELRENLQDVPKIHFSASGSNWGMACNGLHMIDLFSYLTQSKEVSISFSNLDEVIVDSKRSGFKETFGTINGNDEKGSTFSISCHQTGEAPLIISILTENYNCVIRDGVANKSILIATSESNWEYQEKAFLTMYQSELTHLVIEELCELGNCGLTTFADSKNIHLKFINGLIQHFSSISTQNYTLCPIT